MRRMFCPLLDKSLILTDLWFLIVLLPLLKVLSRVILLLLSMHVVFTMRIFRTMSFRSRPPSLEQNLFFVTLSNIGSVSDIFDSIEFVILKIGLPMCLSYTMDPAESKE